MQLQLLVLASLALVVSCAHNDTAPSAADHAAHAAHAMEETADATIDAATDAAKSAATDVAIDASKVTFGNGEANWIITDGLKRAGKTFTFKEVQIDGNGWLVLHPFENGRPNGRIYAAASYIEDGENSNVEISLKEVPNEGELFLVMLHRDINEDQNFDFVFVDEQNVLDKAVFEGMKMIAHTVKTP